MNLIGLKLVLFKYIFAKIALSKKDGSNTIRIRIIRSTFHRISIKSLRVSQNLKMTCFISSDFRSKENTENDEMVLIRK